MIILILIMTITGVAFWQPSMSDPYRENTKEAEYDQRQKDKQEYITYMNGLMSSGNYSGFLMTLAKPKYSLDDLPKQQWKKQIASKLEEIRRKDNEEKWLLTLEAFLT